MFLCPLDTVFILGNFLDRISVPHSMFDAHLAKFSFDFNSFPIELMARVTRNVASVRPREVSCLISSF